MLRLSEDQLKELQQRQAKPGVPNRSPARKAAVRPKQTPGQMNKTEARYLHQVLEPGVAAGRYCRVRFEAIRLKLAERTHYTPDFMVINASGEIEFHEVKGGRIEEDAKLKFKLAAELYPEYHWKLVQQKNTRAPWVTLLAL